MTLRELLVVAGLGCAFFLATPAEGQRKVESIRDRAPHAVNELARHLNSTERATARHVAQEALNKKLPAKLSATERVAAEMAYVGDALSDKGLGFVEWKNGPTSAVTIEKLVPMFERRPSNERVVEAFSSVVRRDEVIDELAHRKTVGASPSKPGAGLVELRSLDGIPGKNGAPSQLEQFLTRDLKIQDHAAVAASFDPSALVKVIQLKQEVTLLRLFGGNSGARGRFYFCCLERGSGGNGSDGATAPFAAWTDASGLATPPDNMLEDLAVMRVPVGTQILVGIVADNFPDASQLFRPGGNVQVFVPAIKGFPYQHYKLAQTGASATDIVVKFEDGVVGRFRP